MTNRSVIMSSDALDAKKRLILGAARDLLVQRGFQDIVLDEVARKAGVAKGTLFLHYRSKEELFSAAFADLVDRLGSALEALPGSGRRGKALLSETVRTILAHFDANRDFMSQFGAGRFPSCGARSSEKLLGKFAQNMRRVVRILKACARDGALRPRDLDLSAVVLFGLCRSSVFHRLLTGRELSLEARTRKVVEFFLNGAGGRK